MSSRAPATPVVKSAKTPSLSTRKRRRTVDDEAMEDAVGASDLGGVEQAQPELDVCREEIREYFGEDRTWFGSHFFASITTPVGRASARCFVYLWIVFAVAFEQGLQFGPSNAYNVRNAQLVADFVVEQWGVRPRQIEHFPSGGKTVRYLLTFDGELLASLLGRVPRGWTKLARGLGCRISSPSSRFCSPFPITIARVPACLRTSGVKSALLRLPYVRSVSDVQRVVLENNVKTDRLEALLELIDSEGSTLSNSVKDVSFTFDVDGFRLEVTRRQFCMTCGEDDHRHADCPVRQRLGSSSVKGWSYLAPAPEMALQGDVAATTTADPAPAPNVVSVETSALHSAAGEASGSGGKKKKGSRKRRGEEGDRPAKKAKA